MLAAAPVQAETLRIATYAAPFSRDGPGLLLRDLTRADDPQIDAAVAVILRIAPDVLVLTDFDYDLDGLALNAFAANFADRFPYQFAARPNAGIATGLDLDGNGRNGEARDALGYGRFAGDGGIAVLSRHPILANEVQDFSSLLWRDLPNAVLPQAEDGPFLPKEVLDVLPVSSTAHWVVPVTTTDGPPFHLMVWDATPPVFDGPEDMNGLRNRDELRLWALFLDGAFGPAPANFIVAGNANLDPAAGDGHRDAMAAFLARPDLQDPHAGQFNADWGADGPGQLRVSYLLPSRSWQVLDAGTDWPEDAASGDDSPAGPHRLVWVDVSR